MKKKGNKKMHTPRQKVIPNTIPTSLKCGLFVMNGLGKEKRTNESSLPNAYIKCVAVKQKCRDGGWAPERGDPPEGGVAALPTTSAGGDFGDNGL